MSLLLNRRVTLGISVLVTLFFLWHADLGRNLMGFFSFAGRADFPQLLAQPYSQILTLGELFVFQFLAKILPEGAESYFRLAGLLTFIGFMFAARRLQGGKDYPLLLAVAVVFNPLIACAIITGQLTPLWVMTGMFSILAARKSNYAVAGLLLGLTFAFSHVGILVAVYFLFARPRSFIGTFSHQNT